MEHIRHEEVFCSGNSGEVGRLLIKQIRQAQSREDFLHRNVSLDFEFRDGDVHFCLPSHRIDMIEVVTSELRLQSRQSVDLVGQQDKHTQLLAL